MSNSNNSATSLAKLIEETGFDIIGHRIRLARIAKKLSIRELAEESGVSKNTLMRVERGLSSHPSTIKQIFKTLKLKPADFLEEPQANREPFSIQRKCDLVWFDMQTFLGDGSDIPLTKERQEAAKECSEQIPFSCLKSRMPGGVFNPNFIELYQETPVRSHRGEEFVLVLEGQVRVKVGQTVHELEKHESMAFYAAEIHSYEPLGEVRPVVLLSIILDPYPREQVKPAQNSRYRK